MPPPTDTSSSILGNLPFAVALAIAWHATSRAHSPPASIRGPRSPSRQHGSFLNQQHHQHHHPDQENAWRSKVGSKVVEHAWERFCGGIIQQWIYATWYASLTPDTEFPAEVRYLLNTAFGELCCRALTMDVRGLLIR
jgi:hypothetical protein